MGFKDLPEEDQQHFAIEDKKVRTILRQFMQLVKETDFLTWEEWSNATIGPLLGKLSSEDVLPNTTSLAGALDMTVADVLAVRALAKQLYSLAEENRALIVKAIGINAE